MGATVHELADMLNHSDTNTVKRYVHGISQDAALSKVRALLDAPATPAPAPVAEPVDMGPAPMPSQEPSNDVLAMSKKYLPNQS